MRYSVAEWIWSYDVKYDVHYVVDYIFICLFVGGGGVYVNMESPVIFSIKVILIYM